jgi:hypothetical protein
MPLKQINARLQKIDPCVELVKAAGYHYFSFDNGVFPESREERKAHNFQPIALKDGSKLVIETEIVYVTYTSHWSDDRWVEEGSAFSKKVRDKRAESLA